MTKTMNVLKVLIGLSLGAASAVSAQTLSPLPPQAFVNVSVGAQPSGRTVTGTQSFPSNGETAIVDTDFNIPGGFLFDIGGGYHVWGRVTVGASVSFFNHSAKGSGTGQIPNPDFFDRPATVNVDLGELDHSETGINVFASYWIPISEKIDLAVSVGPSFTHVSQDVASYSVPELTQQLLFTVDKESGTAVGFNVGVDGSYMLTPRYGVGLFLRYAGGSVDLPSVPDFKVGGFQIGGGARLRF